MSIYWYKVRVEKLRKNTVRLFTDKETAEAAHKKDKEPVSPGVYRKVSRIHESVALSICSEVGGYSGDLIQRFIKHTGGDSNGSSSS